MRVAVVARALQSIAIALCLAQTLTLSAGADEASPEPVARHFPRGLGPVIALPPGEASWDETTGSLCDGEGRPVFLVAVASGERALDGSISLWDLGAHDRRRWIDHLASNGINALALTAPTATDEAGTAGLLQLMAGRGLWALFDATDRERLAPRLASHRAVVFHSGEQAPLIPVDSLAPEGLVRHVMEGAAGVVTSLPLASSPEELARQVSFSIWVDLLPWETIRAPLREIVGLPPGVEGVMRGDDGEAHRLIWIRPVAEARETEVEISGLAEEALLVDILSLSTLRRRRIPARGPDLTVTLVAREIERGCVLLITPLPDDWISPPTDE
ncbi:hypothetical protein JXA47_05165 [Candidatus Sumerlaeota bacterium]|nr:hypothetical protein [Candidatus Sumerlaeota bacterium]